MILPILPYEGKIRVTKLYGTPPPKGFTYAAGKHSGIDLVGVNSKNIRAIADGTVIRSGYDPSGWGNYVVVTQSNGYSCIYAHLSKRNVVVNEKVKAGQILGIEGNTGNVTGSHLHLELRKTYADRMSTIDPAEYLGIKKKVGDVEMEKEKDAVSPWAKEAWEWAKEQTLLDGTRPTEPITREEMAVVLQRLAGEK